MKGRPSLFEVMNKAPETSGAVSEVPKRAWFRPRRIGAAALFLTCLAVGYPALRMGGVFPRESIMTLARDFNPERARSLDGRFQEEDHVLKYIGSRIWFGWGTVGRTPGAETFGEGEPGLDGWWTIQLGCRGLVGVMLWLLLLGIPVFQGWRWLGRRSSSYSFADRLFVAALMGILAVRMIDLLINGWWNNLPVFLAGALNGLTSPRWEGVGVGALRPRLPG